MNKRNRKAHLFIVTLSLVVSLFVLKSEAVGVSSFSSEGSWRASIAERVIEISENFEKSDIKDKKEDDTKGSKEVVLDVAGSQPSFSFLSGRTSLHDTHRLIIKMNKDDMGEVEGEIRYPDSGIVTVKATPKKGYYFYGWEEKGRVVSKEREHTFMMKEDKEVVAIFRSEEELFKGDYALEIEEEIRQLTDLQKRVKTTTDLIDEFLESIDKEEVKNKVLAIKKGAETIKEKIKETKDQKEERLEILLDIKEEKKDLIFQRKRVNKLMEASISLLPVTEKDEKKEEVILQIIERLEQIRENLEVNY